MEELDIGDFELDTELDIGDFEFDLIQVYPELENILITPSGVEQNFKSENYYGYDKIKVKAVASDTLNAIPTEENQTITGLFGIVNIEKIPEKYVVPKVEEETLILSRGNVDEEVLTI